MEDFGERCMGRYYLSVGTTLGVQFSSVFKSSPEDVFTIVFFLERERPTWNRNTYRLFPHEPWLRIKPAALVCALTGNHTRNLLLFWMILQLAELSVKGSNLVLDKQVCESERWAECRVENQEKPNSTGHLHFSLSIIVSNLLAIFWALLCFCSPKLVQILLT